MSLPRARDARGNAHRARAHDSRPCLDGQLTARTSRDRVAAVSPRPPSQENTAWKVRRRRPSARPISFFPLVPFSAPRQPGSRRRSRELYNGLDDARARDSLCLVRSSDPGKDPRAYHAAAGQSRLRTPPVSSRSSGRIENQATKKERRRFESAGPPARRELGVSDPSRGG